MLETPHTTRHHDAPARLWQPIAPSPPHAQTVRAIDSYSKMRILCARSARNDPARDPIPPHTTLCLWTMIMTSARALTLLLLVLLTSLTACGGTGGLGSFTITEESQESVVQGGGGGILGMLPFNNFFPPLQLNIDLQSELDARDAGPAKAIYLDRLRVVTTPTEQPQGDADNFDFVDEITVFVESTKSNTALQKVQIAEIKMVPAGATTMEFSVDRSVNLKPYVEEGIRLTTQGKGEQPPDNVSLKAILDLNIDLL